MTGAMDDPRAEVEIDLELVHALLRRQHPDLADRPLAPAGAGWDNVVVRLGSDLAVRLPRRAIAAPLLEHELRWSSELQVGLTLPIPVALRSGTPDLGYPFAWCITPWFEGRPALHDPPADLAAAGQVLGAFVRSLRRPAPTDAPFNPYRGIPLAGRSAMVAEGLAALDAGAHGDDEHWDTDHLRRCWATHLAVPTWDGPAMWLHGDLHPLNIIVRDGRVAAIIDLGDLTSGDPATDLFVAWALLPVEHRPAFRAAAAVDDHTWARGRGWALCMGLAYVVNQSGDAELRALGQRMLREVLSDPEAAD